MIHVAKAAMVRRLVILIAVVAGLLCAGPRVRLGGITAGGAYTHGWGPGWGYGMPYWGYYDPFWPGMWPSAWMHPGYLRGFTWGPGLGEVKIASAPADAIVYLEGAYAGEARKLRSMWLEPGVYELEIRKGNSSFAKKIYVLSGKTLQLRPELKAEVRK